MVKTSTTPVSFFESRKQAFGQSACMSPVDHTRTPISARCTFPTSHAVSCVICVACWRRFLFLSLSHCSACAKRVLLHLRLCRLVSTSSCCWPSAHKGSMSYVPFIRVLVLSTSRWVRPTAHQHRGPHLSEVRSLVPHLAVLPPHVCHRREAGPSPLAHMCSRMWSFLWRLHILAHSLPLFGLFNAET